ncbi:MAG: alpha/beta hydrolase [Cyanobacteriota bacterium]|nr:alpha/beta hydrolase [Cyanobacteriota bacterium]
MTYNFVTIRQLIRKALTSQDFDDLVFDHFPSVQEQFTSGQTQSYRIRILLDYAKKHREIEKLLKAIKEINPTVYQNFDAKLGAPSGSEAHPKPLPTDVQTLEIQKCDILVLAANPINTPKLKIEQEAASIRERLQEGEVGKNYVVKVENVARAEDLSKYLLQYDPVILHFSGHGNSNGDIIFNNARGQPQPVSPEALAKLLAVTRGRLECTIFNACFSLEKADALVERVSCIVGMNRDIDDESAVRFAAGFYRGLGFGRGYYQAFELGHNEIQLLNLPGYQIPHFVTRDTSTLHKEKEVEPRVTRTFSSQPTTATLYPLWFGTNRKPIDSQNISRGFSGKRDSQLHYGTCQVAVPQSHKIGSTGSPWWQRLLTLTDDRLKLESKSLKILEKAAFWAGVQRALQEREPDERSALVFIHGFNVSFEDAAKRAAQIGFDLQVRGIMAFYSWPSKGKLVGYTADEATIEASEQHIAEFLLNLTQKSGVEKIHIMAHSMGNRGLLRAMQRILARVRVKSDIPLGQIFLAAPDVDPDVFKDLARSYRQLAERTTLYISAKDKALATSGIIHDYPRVGFYPPITIVEGIDTVEVSNIDLTLLGHGYYGDARDLLQDMHELLVDNTPPERRFGLQAIQVGTITYWRIRG